MRFQPISGHVLAAASDKVISVFDVETDRQTHSFQVRVCIVFFCMFEIFIKVEYVTIHVIIGISPYGIRGTLEW